MRVLPAAISLWVLFASMGCQRLQRDESQAEPPQRSVRLSFNKIYDGTGIQTTMDFSSELEIEPAFEGIITRVSDGTPLICMGLGSEKAADAGGLQWTNRMHPPAQGIATDRDRQIVWKWRELQDRSAAFVDRGIRLRVADDSAGEYYLEILVYLPGWREEPTYLE